MNKHQIFQTAILALLTVAVSASEVTLPNEFIGGERARASEVNENFDAVKEAVDDNHARIAALETGTVSISIHAFNEFYSGSNDDTDCDFRRILNYAYFNENGSSCIASAPVTLPDGATITGGRCLLYDNDSQAAPNIYPISLVRSSLDTGTNEVIYSSIAPTLTQAEPQERALAPEDGITDGNLVDNDAFTYFLTIGFDNTGLSSADGLKLYGCKISYSVTAGS